MNESDPLTLVNAGDEEVVSQEEGEREGGAAGGEGGGCYCASAIAIAHAGKQRARTVLSVEACCHADADERCQHSVYLPVKNLYWSYNATSLLTSSAEALSRVWSFVMLKCSSNSMTMVSQVVCLRLNEYSLLEDLV